MCRCWKKNDGIFDHELYSIIGNSFLGNENMRFSVSVLDVISG